MQPPGSKSITNRALLCASLANGISKLHGALKSDDTIVMIDALQQLGIQITQNWNACELTIAGGPLKRNDATIEVKNSGTSIRFLTAALAVAGGNFRLQGVSRMHQRPIGPLVDALNQLGANVTAESENGCPPVVISNERLVGGKTKIKGNVSSQYLSGLLMASPLATDDVVIELDGQLVSKTYVQMTLEVMKRFGVTAETGPNFSSFKISEASKYSHTDYQIEPDASAASYFWAAAAICGGTATVTGLNQQSLQGDVAFVDCLEKMGCEIEYRSNKISVTGPAKHGIDIDMSDISDTAQTLSVVALFVKGQTRIRGVAHNRVKETDRIGNLAIELRKLGAEIEEHPDGLTITPGQTKPAIIETYDDHRMAMSLSLAGLRQPDVVIQNPDCVSKTYPAYFNDFKTHFQTTAI